MASTHHFKMQKHLSCWRIKLHYEWIGFTVPMWSRIIVVVSSQTLMPQLFSCPCVMRGFWCFCCILHIYTVQLISYYISYATPFCGEFSVKKQKVGSRQKEVGGQDSGSPQLIQASEFWMELIQLDLERKVCVLVFSILAGVSNLLRS